jgi:TrmH family RNA methyltransferase
LQNNCHEAITEVLTPPELQKISFLKTAQKILAVFKKPSPTFEFGQHDNQLLLCLDGIQDPGNLGTIIRLADWFGISTVVCSEDTADVFNPKVVQASMGAISRVEVIYTDLPEFCRKTVQELNMEVFGTFMEGKNIYSLDTPSSGLIVMGNEGQGIRPATEKFVTQKIAIPSFSKGGMESLNVGIAAAIVCSEFRRATSL